MELCCTLELFKPERIWFWLSEQQLVADLRQSADELFISKKSSFHFDIWQKYQTPWPRHGDKEELFRFSSEKQNNNLDTETEQYFIVYLILI